MPKSVEEKSPAKKAPTKATPAKSAKSASVKATAVKSAKPAPLPPTHQQVAQRAHQLWQQHGSQHGDHVAHWLQAEQQLKAT